MKKYVAYNKNSFKFEGFYSEGRKDLPTCVCEVDSNTFMQDKGQHTHFNPDIGWYTDKEEERLLTIENNRIWRDNQLKITDKYLLADYPISEEQLVEIKKYRQQLRDYSVSWNKPIPPNFIQ